MCQGLGSVEELLQYIRHVNLSKIQLSPDDLGNVLTILQYDGDVEIVPASKLANLLQVFVNVEVFSKF